MTHDTRLDGTFTMLGTVTVADHVYGEHRGEHVRRLWTFTPACASGICSRIKLTRLRSGRQLTDALTLSRTGPGVYRGSGRFWIALRCAGRVVSHGGLASERIVVRIVGAQTVNGTPVATALTANYANPSRQNLTRCPGGLGHDAARYTGQRASPLPAADQAHVVRPAQPRSSSRACLVPGWTKTLNQLWAPNILSAVGYQRNRTGDVAFAVRTDGGFYSYRPDHQEWSASVLKAMLLVAYLDQPSVARRALNSSDRALLTPMITRSDNDAANRVDVIIGNGGLNALAARVGMTHSCHLSRCGASR